MRFELQCFHDEPEFKGYVMEPMPYLENNAVAFKCPKCGKETIVFIRWEEKE